MKTFITVSFLLFNSFAFADEVLELYTGNSSGIYYSAGKELCKIINCKVQSSNGSIDNIDTLIDDDLNRLAIVQSDVLYDAHFGLGVFNNHRHKYVLPISILYEESYILVVRANSKIKSFEKLKNQIVNVGKTNSGSYYFTKKLLKKYNMSLSNFKYISHLPINEQGEALCRETIDAAIYVAGNPLPTLTETANICDIKIIPIDKKIIQSFINKNPSYIKTIIKANTYPGIAYDVETIGGFATLIAPANLSSNYVYNLLDRINTSNVKFKLINPLLHDTNINIKVPLHDGAKTFYKNNNLK